MASVNKCIFVGNLTRDPEVKYMNSGDAVCGVSIACNEQWKGKDGEKHESVEYINVVFYKKLAEIVGQYLKKGNPIYVEGRMKTRKYQDKQGQDRYVTEIIATEMQMLGSKGESQPKDEFQKEADKQGMGTQVPPGKFDNFSDDVPFN